jgi:hypothetical protein
LESRLQGCRIIWRDDAWFAPTVAHLESHDPIQALRHNAMHEWDGEAISELPVTVGCPQVSQTTPWISRLSQCPPQATYFSPCGEHSPVSFRVSAELPWRRLDRRQVRSGQTSKEAASTGAKLIHRSSTGAGGKPCATDDVHAERRSRQGIPASPQHAGLGGELGKHATPR